MACWEGGQGHLKKEDRPPLPPSQVPFLLPSALYTPGSQCSNVSLPHTTAYLSPGTEHHFPPPAPGPPQPYLIPSIAMGGQWQ